MLGPRLKATACLACAVLAGALVAQPVPQPLRGQAGAHGKPKQASDARTRPGDKNTKSSDHDGLPPGVAHAVNHTLGGLQKQALTDALRQTVSQLQNNWYYVDLVVSMGLYVSCRIEPGALARLDAAAKDPTVHALIAEEKRFLQNGAAKTMLLETDRFLTALRRQGYTDCELGAVCVSAVCADMGGIPPATVRAAFARGDLARDILWRARRDTVGIAPRAAGPEDARVVPAMLTIAQGPTPKGEVVATDVTCCFFVKKGMRSEIKVLRLAIYLERLPKQEGDAWPCNKWQVRFANRAK